MSSSVKIVIGALLGAGATLSLGPKQLQEYAELAKTVFLHSFRAALQETSKDPAPVADAAVKLSEDALIRAVDARLDRAVSRMEAMSARGTNTVHVVESGRSSTILSGMTTVVVVGLGGYAVSLWWRGKFVTREALTKAVHTVTEGLTSVSRTVDALRGNMKEALCALTGRVEHGIEVSKATKERVDELKDDLKAVHAVISGCEQYLLESSAKQDVTMRGVQLLCGVVAESLAGGQSKRMLQDFVSTSIHSLPRLASSSSDPGPAGHAGSPSSAPARVEASRSSLSPTADACKLTSQRLSAMFPSSSRNEDDETTSEASFDEVPPPLRRASSAVF